MKIRTICCSLFLLALTACGGLPKGIEPVTNFDADRYLGTWYEIARLDHRFERGLSNVSAEYSVKDNDQIRVVNRGYDIQEEQFTEAVGRAKFGAETNQGYLKVSFFGPFFGSYIVFDLDDAYTRAYVSGNDRSYLWFLSRTPTVTQEQIDEFIAKAESLDFPVEELIFVDQSRAE